MTVYTYSQARQRFASLLNRASREGKVMVRKKDGSLFSIQPQSTSKSPLDVEGVKTKATTEDIILAIRESRKQ